MVLLRVAPGTGSTDYAIFRRNGDTITNASSTGAHAIRSVITGGGVGSGYAMVTTDNSGVLEWLCGLSDYTYDVFVEGYWNK
mgnify:FL=1